MINIKICINITKLFLELLIIIMSLERKQSHRRVAAERVRP